MGLGLRAHLALAGGLFGEPLLVLLFRLLRERFPARQGSVLNVLFVRVCARARATDHTNPVDHVCAGYYLHLGRAHSLGLERQHVAPELRLLGRHGLGRLLLGLELHERTALWPAARALTTNHAARALAARSTKRGLIAHLELLLLLLAALLLRVAHAHADHLAKRREELLEALQR